MLKNPSEIIEAATEQEAIHAFLREKIDCIVLDYKLPDINGLDVFNLIQNRRAALLPPVIMLTASGHEDVAVASIKQGQQITWSKIPMNLTPLLKKLQMKRI